MFIFKFVLVPYMNLIAYSITIFLYIQFVLELEKQNRALNPEMKDASLYFLEIPILNDLHIPLYMLYLSIIIPITFFKSTTSLILRYQQLKLLL